MTQSSFDLNLSTRKTRKQAFLQQMETVVPWAQLVARNAYHEGALPGLEEEHLADQDAVCAVQLVDGSSQTDGRAGMSAPETGREA